ncbi:MAG: fibronectin type III domain-containing protein [Acidobacteriota bacterium]
MSKSFNSVILGASMWMRLCSKLLLLLLLYPGSLTFGQEEEEPEKPNNLRVFTRYDGATAVAELLWHDGSDNELGFEVLRSDNGEEFQVVGTVGVNTDHYDDKIGKYVTGPYVFKVRAFNEFGRSEESNIVSILL